ncbi:MAG: amidase [Myxococcales bacterium]|nr:amidase [Polyangiaceae bacterium]MDW8248797.1 amidase [Myxococcales bacterium]
MNPLLLASATQLARQIRSSQISSVEVVEAHITHLLRVNPIMNAVVHERYQEARAEAQQADERRRRGEHLPPLHGVPCTIKECFSLTGMPHSSGLMARKHLRATRDAPAVARLRAAGAIPLGVSNVSELCMWMESNNRVYGRSRNPYDPSRIVGGSSGGEGAAVGSGASPFGLGSDVGGSIRMPAFFNGVFGHKPSPGIVPSSGQHPVPHGRIWRYAVAGPLCRRAEDLPLLLRVLGGPDDSDPSFDPPLELCDPDQVRIQDLQVLDVAPLSFPGVTDDLLEAQERAAEVLARAGARVRKAHFPELNDALRIWSSMLAIEEGPSFAEHLGEGKAIRVGVELGRWLLGRSPYTLPALALVGLEKVTKSSPERLAHYAEKGRRLRGQLEDALGEHGVLLFPPHTRPAPRHGLPLLLPIQWVYTAIFNVLEFAVTQVPLGLNAQGLPLGVQVASRWGNDHLTLAVARELERSLGGWVPPPLLS